MTTIATTPNAASVAARVFQTIQEDIALGYLRPRERLPEEDLAARFNVKRHIIRAGLQELERFGLVRRVPNKGAVVTDYKPRDVKALFELRVLIETAAAERILYPADADVVRHLRAIQMEHDQATRDNRMRQVLRLNDQFHKTLFALCDNPYIVETIRYFQKKSYAVRFYSISAPEYLQKARDDHWEMIRALEHAEKAALVALCRHHLERSCEAYAQAYARMFPEFDVSE